MKLRNADLKSEAEGRAGKERLTKFKALAEKSLRVAAAFAVTFAISCGDDTAGRDGSPDGGDGGGIADGGGDGGTASLCTQYGTGDPHRAVFHLDDAKSVSNGTYFLQFRNILSAGDEMVAGFLYYPASMTTSQGVGFRLGQQRMIDIPEIGQVTFECCEITANPCTSSTGDQNCSATLAATRTW